MQRHLHQTVDVVDPSGQKSVGVSPKPVQPRAVAPGVGGCCWICSCHVNGYDSFVWQPLVHLDSRRRTFSNGITRQIRAGKQF